MPLFRHTSHLSCALPRFRQPPCFFVSAVCNNLSYFIMITCSADFIRFLTVLPNAQSSVQICLLRSFVVFTSRIIRTYCSYFVEPVNRHGGQRRGYVGQGQASSEGVRKRGIRRRSRRNGRGRSRIMYLCFGRISCFPNIKQCVLKCDGVLIAVQETCVSARVRACARARVRACVRACGRACVCGRITDRARERKT